MLTGMFFRISDGGGTIGGFRQREHAAPVSVSFATTIDDPTTWRSRRHPGATPGGSVASSRVGSPIPRSPLSPTSSKW